MFKDAPTCAAPRPTRKPAITNPREEISMMEVHDCFSITELVTYEDLGYLRKGRRPGQGRPWMAFTMLDGKVPCQIDGGLKCFGHPIGASGLRMMYEMYKQLQGKAGDRQVKDPKMGLTHNMGGFPAMNLISINLVGLPGV